MDSIDTRLEALRRKLPVKEETALQKFINAFNATECDVKDLQTPYTLMQSIRNECMRVHGCDVWLIAGHSVKEKVQEFRVASLQHNLDVCFTLLDLHVDNKLMIGERYHHRATEQISIADAESDSTYKTRQHHILGLDDLVEDGIRYEVTTVKDSVLRGAPTEYYAVDAGRTEMGSPVYPMAVGKKLLPLAEYLEVCRQFSRVPRKETLFQAVFDILEEHIKKIGDKLKYIDRQDLQTMIHDLHW